MIASLRGSLAGLAADHAVIDVGGVGYLVYAPRPVLAGLGPIDERVFLYTHLILREDAMTLYGFATFEQRALFETLISVTGIGPKVAMSLLSTLAPEDLRSAVARGDTARLAKVPGIGKRTAERLALELKGKLDLKGLPTSGPSGVGLQSAPDDELAGLLVSLGYSPSEAAAAVASMPADAPPDLEDRLRLALRYFGGA